MEAAPDSSGERPLQKRVPIEPERTASLLESVARAKEAAQEKLHEQQEEIHASLYAAPVKVLGWLMIGGFVFDMFASYHGYDSRLGGVVSLFVGLSVLKGSRSALRIAAFLTTAVAMASLVEIAWTCWQGHPFETKAKWVELGSSTFFAFIVSPCVYLIAEAILAIAALNLRKLGFWTKPVKIYASILGLLLLFGLVHTVRSQFLRKKLERDMAMELGAARDHAVNHVGSMPFKESRAKFSAFPTIDSIQWWTSPGGCISIHERVPPGATMPPETTGTIQKYTEWIRDPSGSWGKLEIKFLVPDPP